MGTTAPRNGRAGPDLLRDGVNISREATAPESRGPVNGLSEMTRWLGEEPAGPGQQLDEARAVTAQSKSVVTSLADLADDHQSQVPSGTAHAAKSVKSLNLGRADCLLGPAAVVSNGARTVKAAKEGDVCGTVEGGGSTLAAAGTTAQALGKLPVAMKAVPGVVGGAAGVVGGTAQAVEGIKEGDNGKAAEGGIKAALGGATIAGAATGNVPLAAGAAVGYLGMTAWEHRDEIKKLAGKASAAARKFLGAPAEGAS